MRILRILIFSERRRRTSGATTPTITKTILVFTKTASTPREIKALTRAHLSRFPGTHGFGNNVGMCYLMGYTPLYVGHNHGNQFVYCLARHGDIPHLRHRIQHHLFAVEAFCHRTRAFHYRNDRTSGARHPYGMSAIATCHRL